MKDRFEDFTKEELVKAWRTLKVVNGGRMTIPQYGEEDKVTIKTLMNRMEETVIENREDEN